MPSILYPIGFTLMFCLSLFLGWSDTSIPLNNLFLMFSGFCLGGILVCIFESRHE